MAASGTSVVVVAKSSREPFRHGGLMRITVKLLVIGMCLSCVALLGACGSTSAGTAAPASSPAKTPTARAQATAYLKAIKPVVMADKALGERLGRFWNAVGATNAFSVAARIKESYLPALEQIQARLTAIKPPPGFRKVHARLEEVCAIENDMLNYCRDVLRRAVYTHTLEPGFSTKMNRYFSRGENAIREFGIALRAAAKGLGLKTPAQLLP